MGKDARTIRQEIEQTRERMGDTVEALAYKTDVSARMQDAVSERVEAVKATIGSAVGRMNTAVTGTSQHGADMLAHSSETVNEAMHSISTRVNDRVSDFNTAVSDGVGGLNGALPANARRAVGMVQENPIGLAVVAFAVGFLAGSLIPASEVERERLGPLRNKVAEQAQAVAGDLVAAGKAVVTETAQSAFATAVTSAQAHGHEVVDAAQARAAQA